MLPLTLKYILKITIKLSLLDSTIIGFSSEYLHHQMIKTICDETFIKFKKKQCVPNYAQMYSTTFGRRPR